MKTKSNKQFRTKGTGIVELFVTQDRELLSMTTKEHKEEVFASINAHKVIKDNTVYHKSAEDKALLKRLKSSCVSTSGRTLYSNSLN